MSTEPIESAKAVDLTGAVWQQSTQVPHTGSDNHVEVAFIGETIAVRDSRNPNGPFLFFTPSEWDAFVGGTKDGEFDL
jgi:hypothetical protein